MDFFKTIIGSIKHWAAEQISDLETKINKALEQKQPIGNYATKEDIPEVPVTSVNGQTGDVTIDVSKSVSVSWSDLTDKPFGYIRMPERTVLYQRTVELYDTEYPGIKRGEIHGILRHPTLQEDDMCIVIIDGDEYHCIARSLSQYNEYVFLGAYSVEDLANDENHYPPFRITNDESILYIRTDASQITIKIIATEIEHNRSIDEFYIPKSIARMNVVEGLIEYHPCIVKSVNWNYPNERGNVDLDIYWGNIQNAPFGEFSYDYEIIPSTSVTLTDPDDTGVYSGNVMLDTIPDFHDYNRCDYLIYLGDLSGQTPDYYRDESNNLWITGNFSNYDEDGNYVGDYTLSVMCSEGGLCTVSTTNNKVANMNVDFRLVCYEYHVNCLDDRYISDTFLRKSQETVPDAVGETVTAEEFNALLAALRNTGCISN